MSEDMDPCECLWNQEFAMRRLISLLRSQSQSYCTESECLDELPGLQESALSVNGFLMVFMAMAFAAFMYAMRPRGNQIQDEKPARNSQDRDDAPPTPPRI